MRTRPRSVPVGPAYAFACLPLTTAATCSGSMGMPTGTPVVFTGAALPAALAEGEGAGAPLEQATSSVAAPRVAIVWALIGGNILLTEPEAKRPGVAAAPENSPRRHGG